MSDKQDSYLADALARISRAGDRQGIRAHMAGREGDAGLAHLLRAAAASAEVMAGRLRMLRRGKVDAPRAGQQAAALAEAEELASTLDALARQAAGQRPGGPALAHCGQVAGRLAELLGEPAGEDARWLVCQICGYVAAGEAPERCPVCGAVASKFQPAD